MTTRILLCVAISTLSLLGWFGGQRTDAPMPPAQAAERTAVPPGFRVTLFAAEPDVRQPIAFEIDDRGRLWVVECYSYPNWITDGKPGRDRIVILEDSDGDGRFDRRTVFYDKGANFSGIELGFGGVWVTATPNLIFIPDRDGDDVPDGEPEIVLDGWDLAAKHNAFSTLKWGPDGWLYGCNGILSNSRVGRPGTPDAERVPINCGVWRYHPIAKRFEAVAHGTTNPWGLDFNDHGEMFITNCVIPHLFHVVPGSHFQRMYGEDLRPNLYGLIASCADHIHWGGGDWTSSRGGEGPHSVAGGGHAHAGAMVYLGDNWPDEYRNTIFTCNIHGRRVNRDYLARNGSGYVATHGKDFLFAGDEWFRGLEMKYGPDGGVFLTDWSDTGECHDYDSIHGVHHDSGRIFKITYGDARPARLNLSQLNDAELVRLQQHKNDYFVRHARRILQERAAAGGDFAAVHRSLWEMFDSNADVRKKLRAIWALHVTGGLREESLWKLLDHANEHVRSWAVRLAVEPPATMRAGPPPRFVEKFAAMAAADDSPLVRLYVASALQRMPIEHCTTIAGILAGRAADAGDAMLPLMIWYAVEPLAARDVATAAGLAGRAKIPLVRRSLARRIASEPPRPSGKQSEPAAGIVALTRVLKRSDDAAVQSDVLAGMLDAIKGRKNVAAPPDWRDAVARFAREPAVRDQAMRLSLIFGDRRARETLEATLQRELTDRAERERALEALVEAGTPALEPTLIRLLGDASLRGPVIRALAAYNEPTTAAAILARYPKLSPPERSDAVATLASRPEWAVALLDAVEAGTVPAREISVFTARRLAAFGNEQLSRKLAQVYGTVRATAREKSTLIANYKAALTPDRLKQADTDNGRVVFTRTCGACHKLFGSGGDVGPDLTGSNRTNLDYLLENVLDPSAVVPREYRLTTIATKSGRVISGIIRERTAAALVVQTENERIALSLDDVEELKESPVSMMPEGILDKLDPIELRDLIAYLASATHVTPSSSR